MGIFNSKNKRGKNNQIKYTKLDEKQKQDNKINENKCFEIYNKNEILFDENPENYSNNSSCKVCISNENVTYKVDGDTKRQYNWVSENYFSDHIEYKKDDDNSSMEVLVTDTSENDIETQYNWVIQNYFGDHIENKKIYKDVDDNHIKKVWGEIDGYNMSQRRENYLKTINDDKLQWFSESNKQKQIRNIEEICIHQNENIKNSDYKWTRLENNVYFNNGDYDAYSEEPDEIDSEDIFKSQSGMNEEQYSDVEHEDFYEEISEEVCSVGYRKINLLQSLQHNGNAHNKKKNNILNIEDICLYKNENIIKNKHYNCTRFENNVYFNNVDTLSDYDGYSEEKEQSSSVHKSEIWDYKCTEVINNKTININSEYDDYNDNEEENNSQLRHYNQNNSKVIEHYDYGDDEDTSDEYEDNSDDYDHISENDEKFSDAYEDISDDYEDISNDYEDISDDYEDGSDDYEDMSDDAENNKTETNGGYNIQTLKEDTNFELLDDYSHFKEKFCNVNKIDKKTDFNNAKQIVLDIEIFPRGELLTLTKLEPNNMESILVKSKFVDTCRGKNVTFHSIKKIFNRYLLALYLLKKADFQRNSKMTELYMYHGTSQQKADNIIQTNFNHRVCKRAFYGQGVYFSPIAFYASRFCGKNVQTKVVLVCRVLIGKASLGTKSTTIPLNGFDSCCDHRGWEIVKFGDDLFYPEYIIECSITS